MIVLIRADRRLHPLKRSINSLLDVKKGQMDPHKMLDLDKALALYTRLIGTPSNGSHDLDIEFDAIMAETHDFVGIINDYTSSFDTARQFLMAELPTWRVHTVHADKENVIWRVTLAGQQLSETTDGIGRNPALALLSAIITAIIGENLRFWRLETKEGVLNGKITDEHRGVPT